MIRYAFLKITSQTFRQLLFLNGAFYITMHYKLFWIFRREMKMWNENYAVIPVKTISNFEFLMGRFNDLVNSRV